MIVRWRCTRCHALKETIWASGCQLDAPHECRTAPLAPETPDGKPISMEDLEDYMTEEQQPQDKPRAANLSKLYWQLVGLMLLLLISFPVGAQLFNARSDLLLVLFFVWPFAVLYIIINRLSAIGKELSK